ncbi:MAG: hypothetical protein IPI81_16115 [Flavobacteriales bacterium]|nr:hypothetical protein [Flavobacteriales bacterium]MCC6936850.1 hypothetical protein [Flavobacteriales bacterium]
MRTIILRSRIRTAGLLFGASLLLIGCGEKCPPENKGGAPGKKLALTGCEGGTTRHRRAKFYTGPELAVVNDTFSVHFMYDPDGPGTGAAPKVITDTKVSIPWPDLLAAEAVVESKVHKPVRGILIHYGMDREKFKPLFQFLYPDDSGTGRGDLVLYREKYFHMDQNSLLEIDPITARNYMDNYINTVSVMRADSGFSKISTGSGDVDPLGEWFSYADNVNALYAANAGGLSDPRLVITCISEMLCYSEINGAIPPSPEFRHILALNIADGTKDVLAKDRDTGYEGMAMDLGHLCPPNCK